MVINHNLAAMNANRQLNIVTGRQAKRAEKLSSGYRVNRAADDAAGLAISEKMRRQIRGLNKGIENAQDGVSLCQIADGALHEMHDMLHRLEELSVKAASGTNTESDRQAIQQEVDQILSEIDRISETSTFNEQRIFSGGSETTASAAGAVQTQTYSATQEMAGSNVIQAYGAAEIGIGAYSARSNITISEGDLSSIQAFSEQMDIRFDGDGTAENPYLISTAEQMRAIAADSRLWSKCFRLTADIDLGGASSPWTPIGNGIIKFSGSFDGGGHLISGLYGVSDRTDYGLFHTVAREGVIKNLGVSGEFSGYFSTIGSITVNNEGTIENCYSSCTISSDSSTVGGIVGRNNGGTIKSCYNTGSVTNNGDCAGGIAGVNGGTIESCYNTGTVSGGVDRVNGYSEQNKCGGIAGRNEDNGTIDDCYNIGNVTSRGGETGGIVGNGKGTVKNSYYIESTVSNGNGTGESASSIEDLMEKLSDNWVYDENLGYPVPKSNSQSGSASAGTKSWWIQCGSEAGVGMFIEIESIDTVTLGISGMDVTTQEGAGKAISMIAGALEIVSSVRSNIGAQQNRLEYTIANESNIVENTTAAESLIRDADMAEEMLGLTTANILAQAGVSVLAQANASNEGVLMLLR